MQDSAVRDVRRRQPRCERLEASAFDLWLRQTLRTAYGPPDEAGLPETICRVLEEAAVRKDLR